MRECLDPGAGSVAIEIELNAWRRAGKWCEGITLWTVVLDIQRHDIYHTPKTLAHWHLRNSKAVLPSFNFLIKDFEKLLAHHQVRQSVVDTTHVLENIQV